MSDIIKFNCDIIPTRNQFSPCWRIDRQTLDANGKVVIVSEEGSWAWNGGLGRWQLFVTRPATNYPYGPADFLDGDGFDVHSPTGVEWDKGLVALHVHTQTQSGGGVITTYSYTSDMTGLVP
jgi:hypothetical protein